MEGVKSLRASNICSNCLKYYINGEFSAFVARNRFLVFISSNCSILSVLMILFRQCARRLAL